MKLILSRHGNTFGPGDQVVWAGLKNDLPLVAEGYLQADRCAEALIGKGIRLKAIYCSPLRRTQSYAEAIISRLKPHQVAELRMDARLAEIDYGEWTGKSKEEVIAQFGEADLRGWEEWSVWPEQGGWGASEGEVIAEVRSFVEEKSKEYGPDDWVLVVTHGGRMRYFLKMIEGEFEKRVREKAFKVRTGHLCRIDALSGSCVVRYWDMGPAAICD